MTQAEQFRCIDIGRWPQETRVEWERQILDDETGDPNDYLFQDEEYREQDQARLDAFNRGDWSFIGIRAKATVWVPIGGGSFAGYTLTSPGLWGTESDIGDDYMNEVFEDEKAALIDAMAEMGKAALAHQALALRP